MNTSINQTCGVSTPPEDSPAAIDTISDNGPGETASRSMNEKSSCEQLLKAEQASHSPANSLPYAGTALPQSTLPQYPVPQTASEVDDSGDGGDSPELVMCWADKMLEGVHSDSEQEGSVLLADTDADQVTQENASGYDMLSSAAIKLTDYTWESKQLTLIMLSTTIFGSRNALLHVWALNDSEKYPVYWIVLLRFLPQWFCLRLPVFFAKVLSKVQAYQRDVRGYIYTFIIVVLVNRTCRFFRSVFSIR